MDDSSKPCQYYSSQRLTQGRRIAPTNAFVEFKREETEQSISERFEQQVAKYPDQVAVKTRNRALSYDGLNKAANRVARAILAKCEEGPAPVALLLEYDTPTIVAILGVLKAGKICVPLDLSYPDARANYILGDSHAILIVTDNKNFSMARSLAKDIRQVINVDEIDPSVSTDNLGLPISPETLASILYTSGSTGQPKGVVQYHRSILHNAMKFTNGCHICAADRLTLFASLSTGQGTEITFLALLNGATLCLINLKEEDVHSLATRLITEEITVYISTATVFRHFVATLTGTEHFPHLRLIRIGSEQIRKSDIELYKKHFPPRCMLGIFFSATETGNMSQLYIDKESEITGSIVPVGYPAQDVEILLLDEDGKQVGFNQIGQIVIKSHYLALGYWRRPDLTRAKFLRDSNGGVKRVYLTGDLGRMSEDGCLEYLGRNDLQVKIRGYRVEPGEIERALLQLDAFKEAAVIAKEDKFGDSRLVAYIVPVKKPVPTITALRHALREKLPDYMVPSIYVFLDVLPVAPNGKVDRRALPAPDQGRREVETTFVEPKDALEFQLNKIWEKIFGFQPIGVRDNFFELGGHSLIALQLVAQVERIFNKSFPPTILFQAPTIAQLANILRQEKWLQSRSCLMPIQANGSNPPFFWIHGESSYAFLPQYLGPDQPLYGLMHQSEDGKPALYTTVEDIAAHYLSQIRTVQPQGPYFLGGYSFGGLVAFEMAKRLNEQAQKVALIALLEPTCIKNCRLPAPPPAFTRLSTNGESFRDRFHRHLRHLLTLESRQKLTSILAKAKVSAATTNIVRPFEKIVKKVACNVCFRFGYSLPPSLRSPYILDIYSQAMRRHTLRPYQGPITLFLTKEALHDPSLNWHVLTSEPLEVHEIPGNPTDMFTEPHRRAWAEQLMIYLDRAQAIMRGVALPARCGPSERHGSRVPLSDSTSPVEQGRFDTAGLIPAVPSRG